MIGEPLDAYGNICCPFHDDAEPSLHVYDDHYHCFGCGAHGDSIDWLMRAEELSYGEARRKLQEWSGPAVPGRAPSNPRRNLARAHVLWAQAQPIAGTLAERYLAETRYIDVAALPGDISKALRFHPRSPFGGATRHPCLFALFRDIETNEPCGIQRIALAPDGSLIDRMMLGRWPRPRAIKLWPAGVQLVAGEGLETTLAAATRVTRRGLPLRPAWALGSAGAIARLPVLPGVEQLFILVDHDLNGAGQAKAREGAGRWHSAGHRVALLKPPTPGDDFNDVILRRRA